MTAPSFVGMGTGSETAPGIPAGLSAGDYMILGVETNNASDTAFVDTPSGWSAIAALESFSGNHTRISLFGKVVAGGESAPTITGPNTFNHIWAAIAGFSGVSNATPYHGMAVQAMNAQTTQWLPGSKSFTDDCLIALWACYNNDSAGPLFSGETNADLSSLTERYDGGTITNNGGGLYLATGVKSSRGAFGPTQVTMGTAGALCAVTLCLQSSADAILPTLQRKSRIVNTRM